MEWKRIELSSTASTNDVAMKCPGTNVVVTALYQSAGRGQAGNTWESERGRNLLMSLKVSPRNLPAGRQFVLSMAGALALRDALETYAGPFTLKWPNDIYYGDEKISGTLIETSVSGKKVQDCVFGCGINVNQMDFPAGIPNPVSLRAITGRKTDPGELLERILPRFVHYFKMTEEGSFDDIYGMYNDSLYRRGKFFLYEDAGGRFEAEITHADFRGHLHLLDRQGRERSYELRELRFVLPPKG